MGFKDKIGTLKEDLAALADDADKLQNKNLRDILMLGMARFDQALEHPDIDRVDADEDQRNLPYDANAELNSGGNALFAASDPGATLAGEEARRRAVFENASTAAVDPAAKAIDLVNNPPVGSELDPAAVKPWDPNAGKSMDPNGGSPTRTDDPGVSHSDDKASQ